MRREKLITTIRWPSGRAPPETRAYQRTCLNLALFRLLPDPPVEFPSPTKSAHADKFAERYLACQQPVATGRTVSRGKDNSAVFRHFTKARASVAPRCRDTKTEVLHAKAKLEIGGNLIHPIEHASVLASSR